MIRKIYISLIFTTFCFSMVMSQTTAPAEKIRFDFYGDTIELATDASVNVSLATTISHETIRHFCQTLENGRYQPMLQTMLTYRDKKKLDDWLYYQLIRSTAEQISPKAANYHRYTLYKWFLLAKSGYATTTKLRNDTLLLYVQSEEAIFDIPYYQQNGKQFVCLNYHDYGTIDFEKDRFVTTPASMPEAQKTFSYRITKLPEFKPENYTVKELQFDYGQKDYHFKVLLNKQVQKIFTNYPTVDYAYQFTIPLSSITYNSLIPLLRDNVKGMGQKKGVEYLMHFTRSAFVFEKDSRVFGREKRLSPEQTLLYDYSDCEDRSAFFFFLVKEIYNLPMIVLSYPAHITVAVKFDEPMDNPIVYKGTSYWVCEPTPQKKDLRIGQLLPALRKLAFEVVYEYQPVYK